MSTASAMRVRRVVLIGGGEHARVVAEAVRSVPELFELVGFVDPRPCEETARRLGLSRLGDDSAVPPGVFGVIGVGAIGVSPVRAAIAARLTSKLAGWATVVHRAAWVSPTASLGAGTVVMAGAVMQTGARTGVHAVVNSGAVLEHDVVLGDYVQLGPGALVGGAAVIGDDSYISLGACVRDHIWIGARALVGMGAVVVADVEDGATVAGVPARRWTRA